MEIFTLLNYAGVAVFAATGALTASRQQLDIVGFIFMATLTGIGGGTLRDIILGRTVFWVSDPNYITVCVVAALLVFFLAHRLESRYRWLLWLDAIGLAAFCVSGAQIGLDHGALPLIAVTMGVLTAACGGILRDVIAREDSVLLSDEIYITCALLGASVFVIGHQFNIAPALAITLGTLAAFFLRAGALTLGWRMPRYKARAKRR